MAITTNVCILVFLIHFGLFARTTAKIGSGYKHPRTDSYPGPKNHAVSIAKQLGFGIKRGVYYLDTLIKNCEGSEDLIDWMRFIDSYLSCDAKTESPKLKQLGKEGHSVHRMGLVCKHWPLKRKCSFKLAAKLNSCLGSHLEDGRAGSNALRLADAHMKFLCDNRFEYSDNLITSTTEPSGLNNRLGNEIEAASAEKRPLNCYHELEKPVSDCIVEMERENSLKSFCQKFQAAKECLSAVYAKACNVKATQSFLEDMLDQLEFDLEC